MAIIKRQCVSNYECSKQHAEILSVIDFIVRADDFDNTSATTTC